MEFRHDTSRHRYVLEDENATMVASTNYTVRQERIVFNHTEIADGYEGQGLGTKLVKAALDDVRTTGRKIVPICAYVRGWIERHPEYDDLVDHDLLALYVR
jgi:predicted GNAT family acetyltransferase